MPSLGTVFIVDDDWSILSLLAEALIEEGYHVQTFSQESEAIAAIVANPPALMLLDLMMPNMSGLEVLQAVRAQGIDTPAIIMTASVARARELEAQKTITCLRKPFDLQDLFACVARHIQP